MNVDRESAKLRSYFCTDGMSDGWMHSRRQCTSSRLLL